MRGTAGASGGSHARHRDHVSSGEVCTAKFLEPSVHHRDSHLRHVVPRGNCTQGGNAMRSNYRIAVAVTAGVAIGALAVQGLHAQAKPRVYFVAAIDVTNPDA